VGENEPYHLKPSPANTTTPVPPHQPTSQCAAYESSVRISVIRGGGGGRTSSPPRQPVFTASLIFLELFQDLLENPDTAADTKGSKFELNSHLVTIALDTAEDETTPAASAADIDGRRRVFYSPADTLALDGSFLFSLEFVFLNGSFNWTERRLACGEVTPPAAGTMERGGGEENPPAMRVSPHCYLAYDNVTADAAPRCVCNRSGTYGLLIPRLQRWEPGVPVRGVSKVGGPVEGVSKVGGPVRGVSKEGGSVRGVSKVG